MIDPPALVPHVGLHPVPHVEPGRVRVRVRGRIGVRVRVCVRGSNLSGAGILRMQSSSSRVGSVLGLGLVSVFVLGLGLKGLRVKG